MSGSHRPEGVFVCAGAGLSVSGKLDETVSLRDMCPTIASYFGIPVDREMDGRAVRIFKDQQVLFSEAECDGNAAAEGTDYTPELEQKVAERLRDLGYFD